MRKILLFLLHFLFAGELLRSLSTEQAWSSYKALDDTKGENVPAEASDAAESDTPNELPEDEESAETPAAETPAADNGNGGSAKTSPPVMKSASVKGNGNGNGKLYGAVIDTVSEDGKTIKVGNLQLKITDKTKNEIGALTAGMKVNLYHGKGYAYGIYPEKTVKQ